MHVSELMEQVKKPQPAAAAARANASYNNAGINSSANAVARSPRVWLSLLHTFTYRLKLLIMQIYAQTSRSLLTVHVHVVYLTYIHVVPVFFMSLMLLFGLQLHF